MEGKHRTRRAISHSGSEAVRLHGGAGRGAGWVGGGAEGVWGAAWGQPAHLEMRQELRQSKQTALTAADYEESFWFI